MAPIPKKMSLSKKFLDRNSKLSVPRFFFVLDGGLKKKCEHDKIEVLSKNFLDTEEFPGHPYNAPCGRDDSGTESGACMSGGCCALHSRLWRHWREGESLFETCMPSHHGRHTSSHPPRPFPRKISVQEILGTFSVFTCTPHPFLPTQPVCVKALQPRGVHRHIAPHYFLA